MQSLTDLLVFALHVPDGFLNAPVALLWWVLTVAVLAVAVRKTSGSLNERQIPLMGVMAAFIFAAQMLNFPVLGGTSGHLLGGALAALLLGPWAGMLVMACVVGLQALLFQDGGLLAMGANIFNMGILTAAVGYWLGTPLLRLFGGKPWGLVVTGFVAAWVSVMVAAIACSLQLALSGVPAGVVFPAMLFVHAFIGVGEGLITLAALTFIVSTRPDLVTTLTSYLDPTTTRRPVDGRTVGLVTLVGLLCAVGAAFISPLASGDPDGLERVAEDQGFLDRALDAPFSILPDYTIPGLDGNASTIIAGIVGLLIVFALAYGIAMLIRSRRQAAEEERSAPRPATGER
ncbi:MAG: energy-coupling factor ABC transporter permease [Chloroflexaceae bacterium]|jgi:cobalt/nickel transport system permease protein|nr:energy-coupling factor ABC transporter permease [Chloroflexaceae bacterium]